LTLFSLYIYEILAPVFETGGFWTMTAPDPQISPRNHHSPRVLAIEIEIVYNNTSKNRLLSLGPPFCYAIQDLVA
jgi:hypothetical protein